ncbi:unnamed protein product, partial [Ixodes pacificus]
SLAENPIQRAYGTTRTFHRDNASRTVVAVMQTQPSTMHTRASIHSGWRVGGKQVWGRPCRVVHVCSRPSRVSPATGDDAVRARHTPPTSDTIQSGRTRLRMAKTFAAKNRVPDITVNLSIFA